MRTPLVIAHRGDSSNALENSLEAFRLALSLPVDILEFDLRMNRDGAFYAMHDRQTGRTAGHDIDIELASSDEIARVRLRNGEKIPSLDEVLDLAAGTAGVNIEIKSDRAGEALCNHLIRNPYKGAMVISSFKEAEVRAVQAMMPGVPVSVIYDTFSPRHVPEYKSKGYGLISLRKNTVTEPLVRACHSHGVRIFVWTVDDEEEIKRCIEWEVDGIYTNNPRVLREIVTSGKQ